MLSVKLFIWQVVFRAGGQLVSRKRNLDIKMFSAHLTLPFIPALFHFIAETCLVSGWCFALKVLLQGEIFLCGV